MRRTLLALVSLVSLSAGVIPAAAQEIVSDVLVFERGQWSVSKIKTDDGTEYCMAQVAGENAWVNIWIEADGTTGIAFDSDDWGYDIKTETFLVSIDNGKSLPLTKPEFTDNQAYFELPYNKTNVNFFMSLRRGRTLFLNNTYGELIAKFPLDGSSASIDAVDACSDRL